MGRYKPMSYGEKYEKGRSKRRKCEEKGEKTKDKEKIGS